MLRCLMHVLWALVRQAVEIASLSWTIKNCGCWEQGGLGISAYTAALMAFSRK